MNRTTAIFSAAILSLAMGASVQAAEPAADAGGLILPHGFHASIVNAGVGAGARHLAVRANGDIYISTISFKKDAPPSGVLALRPGADHTAPDFQRFSTVNNGTGIRFYKGALYTTTPTSIYRFDMTPGQLVPTAAPTVIVDGMPTNTTPNRPIAFDGKGNIYVAVSAQSNSCVDEAASKGLAHPVGAQPCPELDGRGGIWRFSATKQNQKFPADGEQIATGARDLVAMNWSNDMGALYTAMQGRNNTAKAIAASAATAGDDDFVGEEMQRITKGANLGWPYSYYDTVQKARILAPEYGGDGKKTAPQYPDPVLAFPAHSSPHDIAFYDGKQFPREYRGGAFVVMHGGLGPDEPQGHAGYDIVFVPFAKDGKPGTPQIFADGFAGPDAAFKNTDKAMFRPQSADVAPDGSLYVLDGNKGRVWRIFYDGK